MLVIKLKSSSNVITLRYEHESVKADVLSASDYTRHPNKWIIQSNPKVENNITKANQLFSLLEEDGVLEGVDSISMVVGKAQSLLSRMVGLASTKSIRPPPSRYHDDFIEEGSLGRGGYGKVVQCVFKMDQKVYAVKGILMTSVNPLLMPSTAEILTELVRIGN